MTVNQPLRIGTSRVIGHVIEANTPQRRMCVPDRDRRDLDIRIDHAIRRRRGRLIVVGCTAPKSQDGHLPGAIGRGSRLEGGKAAIPGEFRSFNHFGSEPADYRRYLR